ncbi:MarR family winged helix-turn-helix transcriptional regulator [Aestuariispira ectoiniformans]|uniref:MarR family winged helix-turn-helix transcriptional regulator n=1 Tax=Aestuariispira ectoiniformans TaxID=2775080 RepID=UPI00223BE815|nr:MarR family transcriptional regulator [Aestuariispira ectoiniformans]
MPAEEKETGKDHHLLELETHLPYRLGRLTNLIRQVTTEVYIRQSGITGREWRVLGMIGIVGHVNAREIARLTGMDKATVTRAVNRLVTLGVVTRVSDKTDRRSKILELTNKGAALCDRIIPEMKTGGEVLAEALTPEELSLFLTCLDKLTIKAEDLLADE